MFLKITLIAANPVTDATSEYTVLSSAGKWIIVGTITVGSSTSAPVLKLVNSGTQLAIYTLGDLGKNINVVCRVDKIY
ncbi:MAG TPA: hypothetical protein H9742_14255 [Candidatus Acetatifactor stercoripullorum]|uniref:Uncharacterized protein n=1 Tax=Candidatus Acetatifactor stercoripullorum TaxID=2838414 RepID=A0A9D1R826_9FIRM|nr:hypothetical protein [Candidatus Acetatifactor stercoripullorum]